MAKASLVPDHFKGKGTPLNMRDLLAGQLKLSAVNIVVSAVQPIRRLWLKNNQKVQKTTRSNLTTRGMELTQTTHAETIWHYLTLELSRQEYWSG